jgi:acetyltransferase-like isoleucine patch superfamily enzyme
MKEWIRPFAFDGIALLISLLPLTLAGAMITAMYRLLCSSPLLSSSAFYLWGVIPFLFLIFLSFWIILTGLILRIVPKPTEGEYSFPKSFEATVWTLRFAIRRPLTLTLIREIIQSFYITKFLFYWAGQAQVPFGKNTAKDIELMDPEMIVLGSGGVVGSRTQITGHLINEGEILLKKVAIGNDVNLAGGINIAPGCRIADEVTISYGVQCFPHAQIGEESYIGAYSIIGSDVVIGKNVIVGNNCQIDSRAVIEDYAVLGSGCYIGSGSKILEGEKIHAGSCIQKDRT